MIKAKAFKNLTVFILLFILLLIAFWPAVSSYYAYHDDVIFFLKTPTRLEAPGTVFNLSVGRFIGAHLYMAEGFLINSVDDLKGVRFLGVLSLVLCAFVFFLWIRKKFFSSRDAFLISAALFTLPPFQITAAQTAMAYQPVSILFALGAFACSCRLSLTDKIYKRMFNGRFVLSVFLFFCALSTYKPTAMFYWTMVGAVALFADFSNLCEIKNRFVNLFLPAIFSMVLYAGTLQLMKPYFSQFNLWDYNPYELTTDYLGKIIWFLKEPLVNAINLWNIFPNKIWVVFWGMVVFSAAAILKIFQSRDEIKERILKQGFVRTLLLFILLLLAFLPNLASSQSIFYYRCAGPLTVLVFFIFLWSIKVWIGVIKRFNKNIFSGILLVFCFLGITLSYQTILRYRVIPSQEEIQFVKDKMMNVNINEYQKIYFIQPQEKYLKNRGDEFGNLTTVYSHNMIGLVSCVLREMAKGKLEIFHIDFDPQTKTVLYIFRNVDNKKQMYRYQIKVDSGILPDAPKVFREKTLVIDMTGFENRK